MEGLCPVLGTSAGSAIRQDIAHPQADTEGHHPYPFSAAALSISMLVSPPVSVPACPDKLRKFQALQARKEPQKRQRIQRKIHDSINQPTPLAQNLTRDTDKAQEKLLELHPDHVSAQARLGDQKPIPGL